MLPQKQKPPACAEGSRFLSLSVEAPGIETAEIADLPGFPYDRGFADGSFSEPILELSIGFPVERSEAVIGDRNVPDPVEAALAIALTQASAAGEWAVVSRLAAELAARRAAQ